MYMGNDYKIALLNTGKLKKTGTAHEYSCNCPFCGDTHRKMYMHIDLDTDDPVMYNCFKCPAQGRQVTEELLTLMGVDLSLIKIPRNAKSLKKLNTDFGISTVMHDPTCNDDDDTSIACQWIGRIYNVDTLQSFQYIGNPRKFVDEYLGVGDGCDGYDVLNGKVWFKLTDGGMIGYDVNGDGYRIYRCRRLRVNVPHIYQMKTLCDLTQTVNVVICNGIKSLISLYDRIHDDDKMLNKFYCCSIENTNVGMCLHHMIAKGVFGKSIYIHLYVKPGENVWINDNMKMLFGKIFVYDYDSLHRKYKMNTKGSM